MNLKLSLFRSALLALASTATAAATAGGYADAPEDSHQPSALFRRLDTNHDGYVSSSEAAKMPEFAHAFADADDNGDGKLSADEFIKAEAIYERRQMAQYADDSVITAKVKAALIKDLELKAFDVGVETYRGRVLLSGFVDSRHQAQRAIQLAAGVRGVARVEDALKLK